MDAAGQEIAYEKEVKEILTENTGSDRDCRTVEHIRKRSKETWYRTGKRTEII